MKKLVFHRLFSFILIASMAIAFSSCQKGDSGNGPEDNTPEYYVSFKANGIQEKYTSKALASLGYSAQTKLYNDVLQGYHDYSGSQSKSLVGIIIFSNSAVAVSVYQDPEKATNADGSKVPRVLINYADDAGNLYITEDPVVNENG